MIQQERGRQKVELYSGGGLQKLDVCGAEGRTLSNVHGAVFEHAQAQDRLYHSQKEAVRCFSVIMTVIHVWRTIIRDLKLLLGE